MRMWTEDALTKLNGKGKAQPYTSQMKVEEGIAWMQDYHQMKVVRVEISENEPDKNIAVKGVEIVPVAWIRPFHYGMYGEGDTNGTENY